MIKYNEYTYQIRSLARLVLNGFSWWKLIKNRKSISITLYELADKIDMLSSELEAEKELNKLLIDLCETEKLEKEVKRLGVIYDGRTFVAKATKLLPIEPILMDYYLSNNHHRDCNCHACIEV